VRLGSIEVTGEGPPWLGRLEFVVPDLAPGTYGIWHCNDPCETGLGDVVFWEMHVVESDGEGRLWSKLDALEQKSRAWKYRNSIDLRRVERRLGRQIKELEARVTQLEARPVAHRKVERSGTVPWAVAVMALGIAGAVAGVLARKRKLRLDTTQTRS
jgi:hypothetical protein